MSRDWKFVKLKDVCQVVTGSTPKTNIPEYWDGEYPWVTPAELKGDKYIKDTERHITDEAVAHTNLTLMPIGTVLLSSRAPIGKVAITETEMYCNQGFKNLICSDKIDNQYLYLWLSSQTEYLNSLGRGATFKEISKTIVENIEVPLTSIEKQHKIVAELEQIKSLLSLKRKELEIYDKLAQSLFYEMFGDPVENEKGWEVKKVSEICSVYGRIGFRGYTKADFVESSEEGAISLSPTNIINNTMDFNKCSYVTWDKYNESPEIKARIGDILLVKTGSSYGKCALITELPHKATINPQFVIIKDCKINNRYLHYYLCSEAAKINYDNFVIGTAVPTFSQKNLNNMKVLVPPLPLQQTFANRIEAIEAQKAQVKAAIEKLETLLAARMQYWFE